MTYPEIDRMMRRMLPNAPASWLDARNDAAKAYFCFCMRERHYGYEPLLDAWEWFLEGYNSALSNFAPPLKDTQNWQNVHCATDLQNVTTDNSPRTFHHFGVAMHHSADCICLNCRNARVTSANPHGWPDEDTSPAEALRSARDAAIQGLAASAKRNGDLLSVVVCQIALTGAPNRETFNTLTYEHCADLYRRFYANGWLQLAARSECLAILTGKPSYEH